MHQSLTWVSLLTQDYSVRSYRHPTEVIITVKVVRDNEVSFTGRCSTRASVSEITGGLAVWTRELPYLNVWKYGLRSLWILEILYLSDLALVRSNSNMSTHPANIWNKKNCRNFLGNSSSRIYCSPAVPARRLGKRKPVQGSPETWEVKAFASSAEPNSQPDTIYSDLPCRTPVIVGR